MRGVEFSLLGFLVGHSLCAQDTKPARSERPHVTTALDLLNESNQISGDFVPYQRCRFLLRLSDTAVSISGGNSKRWAEEAFFASFALPPSWDRVAVQKNALMILSRTDPDRAFELLGMVDSPVRDNTGALPEDVRAHGAQLIFPAYWSKNKSGKRLQAIRQRSRELGETGQYPFLAVSGIFNDLMSSAPDEAGPWFEEITKYLARSTVDSANAEFIEFLKKTWDNLPEASRRTGVELIFSRLIKPDTGSENKTYRARVDTTLGVFELRSRQQVLLLRIMPWVSSVMPERLEDIQALGGVFLKASQPGFSVKKIQEMMLAGPASPAASGIDAQNRVAQLLADNAILAAVTSDLKTDLNQASQDASRIQDPNIQSRALLLIANAMRERNDSQAAFQVSKSFAKGSESQAPAKTDPAPESLARWVLRAQIAETTKNDADLKEAIEKGFDLLEQQFEEYMQKHPVSQPEDAPVMDAGQLLIEVGMREKSPLVLGRIRVSTDSSLKAYLLMFAASALHNTNGLQGEGPQ